MAGKKSCFFMGHREADERLLSSLESDLSKRNPT